VLRQAPVANADILHTPVHLASVAARGFTEQQAVIDAVWAEFSGLTIKRAYDAKPIIYYGHYASVGAPATLRRTLAASAGQCNGMATLLRAALGAQGIESRVKAVGPFKHGNIHVKNWDFLAGASFVTTGPDGICDTTAAGDDEQAIAVGHGRPHTRAVQAAVPAAGPTQGDDQLLGSGEITFGNNGFVETPVTAHEGHYVATTPLGFGYPMYCAYYYEGDPLSLVIGGDDRLVADDSQGIYRLRTGADGILQTEPQPGLEYGNWGCHQVNVGQGISYAHYHVSSTMPIRDLVDSTSPQGDDQIIDGYWLSTGTNGIADTPSQGADQQLIAVGHGLADVPCVGPGPDGVLQTVPAGDDGTVDIAEILAWAEPGYEYVPHVNMWPAVNAPGQNSTAPPPEFIGHFILRVGSAYYDPSYGSGPFSTLDQWEQASLSAVSRWVYDAEDNKLGLAAKRVEVGGTANLASFYCDEAGRYGFDGCRQLAELISSGGIQTR